MFAMMAKWLDQLSWIFFKSKFLFFSKFKIFFPRSVFKIQRATPALQVVIYIIRINFQESVYETNLSLFSSDLKVFCRLLNSISKVKNNRTHFLERNWVFATNSSLLVQISFQSNFVHLRYVKLWTLLDQRI